MERELPPPPGAGRKGPTLVGLLAQLALIDRHATPPAFVQGMGRWLGWKDAIPLSAVLQAPLAAERSAAVGSASAGGAAVPTATLERDFKRVHDTLTQTIVNHTRAAAVENGADFLPFRRCCSSLQQAIEAAISPLRVQLRAAVAALSPQAAQLAALDAVMAAALAPQEQAQLAQLPALLDKHFTRLRQDPPANTPWLDTFTQDMQRLLLAELALRLQPAQGLLDTLRGTPEGLHE